MGKYLCVLGGIARSSPACARVWKRLWVCLCASTHVHASACVLGGEIKFDSKKGQPDGNTAAAGSNARLIGQRGHTSAARPAFPLRMYVCVAGDQASCWSCACVNRRWGVVKVSQVTCCCERRAPREGIYIGRSSKVSAQRVRVCVGGIGEDSKDSLSSTQTGGRGRVLVAGTQARGHHADGILKSAQRARSACATKTKRRRKRLALKKQG